jgi:hypothetical protein
MNTVLTITGLITVLLLIIILIIGHIYDTNKAKKKYKKSVEELKVGNRYKMKKFLWVDDDPFMDETYIVEIIDIKVNSKNEIYVQYKQIEPEYKGKPFSDPFSKFIDCYYLIK